MTNDEPRPHAASAASEKSEISAGNTPESSVEELAVAFTAMREKVRFLEQMAMEDLLLPILNHKALVREGTRILLHRNRHRVDLCFYYLNVDQFRVINETFGFDGGNALLHHLCGAIGRLLRSSDLFGRIGPDEFGAVLMHTTVESVAAKCAELETKLNDNAFVHLGRPVPFQVSWSLLSCDGHSTIDDIIEQAKAQALRRRAQRQEGDRTKLAQSHLLSSAN